MVRALRRFPWLISGMLYTSLTLSTALQFTWGPEATLRLAGFYLAPESSRSSEFRAAYPDFGSLTGDARAEVALQTGEKWKFSTFWADAAYYVLQAQQPSASIAPYKYRFLPTAIVGLLSQVTRLSVEWAFVLFNAGISVATALVFERCLRQTFQLGALVAMLGSSLFIASASNVGTVAFPMLEPASAFFSCIIFMTARRRSALAFACAAVAAVATKEILVFSSVLWWLHRREDEPIWRCLALASLPIVAFATIRVLMGGSALEVNYGFNLLHGELPQYGQRLFGLRTSAALLLQIFLSFSFLWFGLLRAHRHPLLKRELILVPLVIFAAVMLSGRITRVLGVLFPIVLPAFLLMLCELVEAYPASGRGGSRDEGTA
jgi:hypothetical protein